MNKDNMPINDALITTEEASKWEILEIDPYLKNFADDINLRMENYENVKSRLVGEEGKLYDFANGHLYYGFHKTDDGWYYREWAPKAISLHLVGDFNNWNGDSHPLKKDNLGNWEIFIPGKDSLKHGQKVKVRVTSANGTQDRIPAYIYRTVQDTNSTDYNGQIWCPDSPFEWTDHGFNAAKTASPLFIYECHVGMAQEKEGIGTYLEFAKNILPHVKESGYNAIQLMGIMEHPYYASFGYQVSSFFAASSRFGTPNELKLLINTAHSMGIAVLLDLVHSHAIKNTAEGLDKFDGSDHQYFHRGSKGIHPAWDSKLFDYGSDNVLHFLLSNIKFWMEEYHFDGFRFDGVTSMLYHDHGLGESFDSYNKHFSLNTDTQAVTYLQLANELIKQINPNAITIAEDMSGMPGMCLPITSGGIGFDYRLSMGVPDFWVKTLSKCSDDQWDMFKMWYELTASRTGEKYIGYCESHDQALVGDKTLIFWLADKDMYDHMDKASDSITINRAIELHKMIRLITSSSAGEGYLNFMGNEFGHPEWIDFPREGNGWSYKYARRQWSLCENGYLKYQWLYEFDKAMLSIIKANTIYDSYPVNLWINQNDKIIAYRREKLVFIFNFHPTQSQPAFYVPTKKLANYKVILSTDDKQFGGQGRTPHNYIYKSEAKQPTGEGFEIYIPARCAIVLQELD